MDPVNHYIVQEQYTSEKLKSHMYVYKQSDMCVLGRPDFFASLNFGKNGLKSARNKKLQQQRKICNFG